MSENVAGVRGKCLCHMSQGSWQMSRRDMTSPHPNPWQMSRHVAMFPHFLLTGGPDGVSAVKKSAQKRKNSFLSPKSLRDGMEMARNTQTTSAANHFFLPKMSQFGGSGAPRDHIMCTSQIVWQMSRHVATSLSCHQISRQMSRHVFDITSPKI